MPVFAPVEFQSSRFLGRTRMSWVPAVSEGQAGPAVKPVYKFLQDNWGFVPNYFLALGTQPQFARPSESLHPCNVRELSELIREGRARMIGLIRQELLSGIKTTEQYERLRVHLRSFPDEVVDTSEYEEAARAGNPCRAKGVAVSIVDILLCAIAIHRQWAIFTTDPDFARYARVLPLRIHNPGRR